MRAITTYTSQSTHFLPLWKKYYSKFFDKLNIIELDESRIRDSEYIAKDYSSRLKKGVLQMITDVDEIIVPNPDKYKDLGDYLNKFNGDIVRCVGFNVIEMPGDKKLDINKKITLQRKYWERDRLYDKPLLTRIPVVYKDGQHNCDKEVGRDADLVMFHLRDADVKVAIERKISDVFPPYNLEDLEERRKKAVLIPKKWRLI